MFKLIKNGELYSPEYQGYIDILLCMDKVVSIKKRGNISIEGFTEPIQIIDADGMTIVPGFIDQHVHFLGGGGKLGYASRAGALKFDDIIRFGVTTAISSLGVDSYLKNLDTLLIRARELGSEGLTAYILTGGFQLPLKSITGDVYNDLIYIDKVIGIGEIGLSDSYSSQPNIEEIIRILANSKAVGALTEKPGIVFIHIGPGSKGMKLIFDIINNSDLPVKQFVVTHVNRSIELLEEAIKFAKLGGRIDITTGISPEFGIEGSITPYDALNYVFKNSVSIDNVTLSSDAGGFRSVDDNNNKIDDVLLLSRTLLDTIKESKKRHNIKFSDVLKTITVNPARIWDLSKKGEIKTYNDADLVFLDSNDLRIKKVMIKGKIAFEK